MDASLRKARRSASETIRLSSRPISDAEPCMLEIRDMVCAYGGVAALKGVSLEVKTGQLVALIGANGAGKSTTLRAISGLVPPRSGSLAFDGRNMTGARPPH